MNNKISELNTHPKEAIFYGFSKCFERASYYGVRGILILYLIDAFKMSNTEALATYGFLTLGVYVSNIIGGLLGDLWLGNRKVMIFGGVLQGFGCLVFMFESNLALYSAIGCFIIGSGFYSVNLLAQFGKQYANKNKILDAGFTGLFFMINIGSFMGVMSTGFLYEISPSYGFVSGAVFVLLAVLCVNPIKQQAISVQEKVRVIPINKKLLYIGTSIFLSGVFWMVYEFVSGLSAVLISDTSLEFQGLYQTSIGLGIVFTLILAIVWTFFYTNQFFKMFLGLLFLSLAVMFVGLVPENQMEGSSNLFVLSALMLALAESFIGPMLYSITTKYINPKYLAIVLSFIALPFLLFNKLAGLIGEYSVEFSNQDIFLLAGVILILVSFIAFFFYRKTKKEEALC